MNKIRYKIKFNLNFKMIHKTKKKKKFKQIRYKNYQYNLMIEPKTYN